MNQCHSRLKNIKKMKTSFFILLIASICISMVSCRKKDEPMPLAVATAPATAPVYSSSLAGFGRHEGTPSGTPFTWPNSIKLVSPLFGGWPGDALYQPYGLGVGHVVVYLKVVNTNATAYNLTFPAGMIVSKDNNTAGDTSQSGITIAPTVISLQANDTSNIILNFFCINENYHPSNVDDLYSIKVTSNNDQIYRLIFALKNKTTINQHLNEIGNIIWDISDREGLTEDDLNLISKWK